MLFLGVIALLSHPMHGQFYISNHDVISISGKVSIQEQLVYINTDIHGDGQLLFNAEKEQVLHTKENIQLPNLALHNPSQLTIYNAVTIHGDLDIAEGHLQLHNRIILKGKLYQGDKTSIEGLGLIIYHTQLNSQPSPLHVPQNSWAPRITYTNFLYTPIVLRQTEIKPKQVFFYTATTPYSLVISIPTPPPEDSF